MGQPYALKRGDTLARLAKRFFGDPKLAKRLADYNGIRDPNLVLVGQVLEIPSKRELLGEIAPEESSLQFPPPNGLTEVIETFGDVASYISDDGTLRPAWYDDALARAQLPRPIMLSWDHSQFVTRILCHKKLVATFTELFRVLDQPDLRGSVKSYGGCFAFRPKRNGSKLSTHSWGIAIDINPETNPMGSAGDLDPAVVEVLRRFGFKWGGDWPGRQKDPMHFQYCTGY
jgi:LysM repeat protein